MNVLLPKCLVPAFEGAFLSEAGREALLGKFYTGVTTTEAIGRAI